MKSQGNGLLKGWLIEGVANGVNFLGGSEYIHSGQRNMVVVGLGGTREE